MMYFFTMNWACLKPNPETIFDHPSLHPSMSVVFAEMAPISLHPRNLFVILQQ